LLGVTSKAALPLLSWHTSMSLVVAELLFGGADLLRPEPHNKSKTNTTVTTHKHDASHYVVDC
jgi:hypothetical protein